MIDRNTIVKPAVYAIACACIALVFVSYSLFVVLFPSFFLVKSKSNEWLVPDTLSIPNTPAGKLILYGRELVKHTSVYLGPKGKVMATSNGMNCQNCHLEAGTKFFGNNYSAVASTYPKFRARSGAIESIEKRVNDCIERSLNGTAIACESKEMQAIVSYIKWVGKDVEKNFSPKGSGLFDLPKLSRAADTVKGKAVFQSRCMRCHGANGQGEMAANELEWKYPPLYGAYSFNQGAGLFRLSRLAGYIKVNMPNGEASFEEPVLTDEESWDVAAYIISLPRPQKDISKDWPDISKKPFDHPFGPFADKFSEAQHKYGPFIPILSAMNKSK